jgi:hypothetical protein
MTPSKLFWVWVCAGLAACAHGLGAPREAFITSSVGVNQGHPHRVALGDHDLNRVADRLIELAKQRELTLVRQSECTGQKRCDLAFRGKPVDRRIFRSTRSMTLSYYSRYFVTLERAGAGVRVSGVGVPVLGGEMSCPPYLQQTQRCTPPMLSRSADKDLITSVRDEWGYDVSGAGEAETLQGLLAELRRPPPTDRTPPPPGPTRRRGVIVAVFDIQDQSGQLTPATTSQLTEYLAAKVTQGGYQVVPRDQLRSQLARQKKTSYRECFDQRCQIELGKAMAAEKSLATKLLKVGGQCAFTALLYDLRSETTERAASVKTACSEEALLNGIEQLAVQLGTGSGG